MKLLSLVNYIFLLSSKVPQRSTTRFFFQNNNRFINTFISNAKKKPTNPNPNPHPRICINCKHFIRENNDTNPEYGKCLYFEKEITITSEDRARIKNNLIQYLVTGIKQEEPKKKTEWFYCSTARSCENMCGVEGKKYEPDIYDTSNMNMDMPTNH